MEETHVPPKLFVVERIACVSGRPFWEKDIMKCLGLLETKHEKGMNVRKKIGTYVVVENSPRMCKILWRVKHLVRVKPVTFPDGLPTPGVFSGTHLNRFGKFTKDESLEVDPKQLEISEHEKKVAMNGREIAKPMHLRWMNSID